ncbi:hypothetical protein OG339_42195 [Streptosporangium sp. NBC_01495]|uniref:hypothetical protein n=1 Tax=Streptosporangium sp. NBC_01495 TaxID=2903899 RepID=UPI002E318594|nr:hypothetical protein [Streptosporangium sp. NBC_01495]
MRIPRIGAVALVVALVAGTAGAGAYAAVAAPPKTVGVCANKTNGGYLRMLEAKNLAKSSYGKCRANEVKVPLSTVVAAGPKGATGAAGAAGRGFDSAPFKLTFSGAGPWTCSWTKATETLACITPAP